MENSVFVLDINKFIQKCRDNADEVVRSTMVDLTTSIMERSPKGDPTLWKNPDAAPEGYVGGHFRANWQLGVDVMPTGEIEGTADEGALEREQVKIPKQAAGHVYYYANNVDYAQVLEDGRVGNKGSTQAPLGIVGLAMVEVQGIINKALAELK